MDISMREFQRNAPKYLLELPINLTNRGVPVATVIAFNKSVIQEKVTVIQSVIQSGTMAVENEVDKTGWMFCQCHWEQTKGKTYPVKLITYEDENGFAVKDKQLACPDCILKYQNMGRGKLYYL